MRIKAFNDQVCLPFIKMYSVTGSTLHAFDKEKALIANEFNEVSSEGSLTMLCKHLKSTSKSIIALQM